MEALVGRILANFLNEYVKDAAAKFENWSLHELEFKEGVVQQLFNVPAYLEVERATCTSIHARVPWASLYAGTDPIVLELGAVHLTLAEPMLVSAPPPAPAPPPPSGLFAPLSFVSDTSLSPRCSPHPRAPAAEATGNSYLDRLIAGIRFEVAEVSITVRTLGRSSSGNRTAVPPLLRVRVRDIVVQSTDAQVGRCFCAHLDPTAGRLSRALCWCALVAAPLRCSSRVHKWR